LIYDEKKLDASKWLESDVHPLKLTGERSTERRLRENMETHKIMVEKQITTAYAA
jgi:hypothetical protein